MNEEDKKSTEEDKPTSDTKDNNENDGKESNEAKTDSNGKDENNGLWDSLFHSYCFILKMIVQNLFFFSAFDIFSYYLKVLCINYDLILR